MKDTPKKNPVLTSPWKIGALVALLLILVGFGGGYYVIEIYDIELEWLQGSFGQWEVDSYAFFREMYPLVAGTFLLSIISYIVVASAVRRYRYFLDSGQDYRKMIQLAGSIDDLTNPTQIAKLKRYPELQSILRNYGDQISSISKQLTEQQSQTDHRSVDLEMEVDALLQGERTQDSLIEDRWWTPLYRKIESQLQDDQRAISGLKMRVHNGKNALGRIALSTGRIIEQIGGTSEDYPEIVNAVNDLNGIAKRLCADGDSKQQKSPQPDKSMLKTIVTEMENTLHKLAEGGKVLNEFSEENNGLALNIALIAAKGEVDEHDLAQFAEKVRSTADRFNKLSRTFTSMAQDLLGTCNTLKKKLGVGGEAADTPHLGEIHRSISGVSKMVEQRCSKLQERLCCIGNEIHDVQELVNKSIKSITEEEDGEENGDAAVSSAAAGTSEISVEPAEAETEDEDSDLVIDHGRVWNDDSAFGDDIVSFGRVESDGVEKDKAKDSAAAEEGSVTQDDSLGEVLDEQEERGDKHESAREEKPGEVEGREEFDVSETAMQEEPPKMEEQEAEEKEYVISIDEEAAAEAEACLDGGISPVTAGEGMTPPAAETDEGEDIAAKEWFKIDIDKSERAGDAGPEEISVRETADVTDEQPCGQGAPPEQAEAVEHIPGLESPEEGETDEEERIYDLCELGAIEYIEEPVAKE